MGTRTTTGLILLLTGSIIEILSIGFYFFIRGYSLFLWGLILYFIGIIAGSSLGYAFGNRHVEETGGYYLNCSVSLFALLGVYQLFKWPVLPEVIYYFCWPVIDFLQLESLVYFPSVGINLSFIAGSIAFTGMVLYSWGNDPDE